MEWGRWLPSKQSRTLALHRNPGLEIIYVARGEVEWVYNDVPIKSTPGSLVMGWPWDEHGIPEGPLPQCEIYWVLLPLEHPYPEPVPHPKLPSEIGFDPETETWVVESLLKCAHCSFQATSIAAELIKQAVFEMGSPTPGHRIRIRGIVNLLLLELAKLAHMPLSQPQSSGSRERVAEFIVELRESCTGEWTLETMADCCGLGRSRFSSMVAEMTGDSPSRLLNRCRIDLAKKYIRERPHSITHIGFECGFGSSQYFSKVFKEFTKKTPSQWRESC